MVRKQRESAGKIEGRSDLAQNTMATQNRKLRLSQGQSKGGAGDRPSQNTSPNPKERSEVPSNHEHDFDQTCAHKNHTETHKIATKLSPVTFSAQALIGTTVVVRPASLVAPNKRSVAPYKLLLAQPFTTHTTARFEPTRLQMDEWPFCSIARGSKRLPAIWPERR